MRFSVLIIFLFSSYGYLDDIVLEDVYVTGSLLKSSSVKIANPIYSFDQNDLKKRGTLQLENFLSHLPQINPSNSSFHSN